MNSFRDIQEDSSEHLKNNTRTVFNEKVYLKI